MLIVSQEKQSTYNMRKVEIIDPETYLIAQDPILGTVISKLPKFTQTKSTNHFKKLIESIISQQLSEKAADTIFNRFISLFPKSIFPTPQAVLAMDTEKIRKAGISYSKISYIKDLAEKIHNKSLDFTRIHELTDIEVIDYLMKVKGIGRWTAEMFLMFGLGREDIFSYGDLGLRNAIQKLYKLKKHPTTKQAEKISQRWIPYRTWACRYLWASLTLKGQA